MKRKMAAYLAAVMAVWFGGTMQAGAQVPDNMVLIPAGKFQMGSPDNEPGRQDYEIPQHMINITRAFYMDKYEVTKMLWNDVYQWATNHGYTFDNRGDGEVTNHPIHSINWYDAIKWCNARSEKEGLVPAYYTSSSQTAVYRSVIQPSFGVPYASYVKWNSGYRLPTEAEWEKAARGGLSGRRFPWGDTISHDQANYYSETRSRETYDVSPTLGFHPAFNDGDPNINPHTSPVGWFAPNGYGLYDMVGNVQEWCWDLSWYFPPSNYYSSSPENDPLGAETGNSRVVRGGSWGHEAFSCRSANRWSTLTWKVYDYLGFRCVLPTTAEWKQVIESQPIQPTYSEPPKKEDAKDSLIVVTHGWQPAFLPVDIAWMDTITNAISKYLVKQGLTEWQVHAYRWVEKARPAASFLLKGAQIALDNAKAEGVSFGKYILEQRFNHVHIISHSAGAGFAQKASETIKATRPDITVHLTFLDPFVGFSYEERGNYGKGADWAENYFSRDTLTSPIAHKFTEGPLDNAYNVDVTLLDPNKVKTDTFRASPDGALKYCSETRTSHGWPYEFYIQTIPPNTFDGSGDFGFPLSKEGGKWKIATTKYATKGNSPQPLGTPDPQCGNTLYVTTPSFIGEKMEFTDTSSTKSSTGTIKLDGLGITLITSSPVWVAHNATITNKANFISFESHFLGSAGSEGLLSVYWNTNVVGTIDERVAPSGIRTNTFLLPETIRQGVGTLGFRLDAFSGIQSSITITNVALGFSGLNQQLFLSATGAYENGQPVLQLTGPAGYNYSIETSSNLTDWTPTVLLVNTSGTVRFIDLSSNNATARFYRAVAP